MRENTKKGFVIGTTAILLAVIYFVTKNISPEALKELGLQLPLPLFTFIIATIDGFNPCNLFVLTLLLSLVLSVSHARKKICIVGYSFIVVVYIFYFLFMIAWLNIFKYIGFIDPLRIGIGVLAVVAGLINCKEYLFYRKGITLMVQDRHVNPLKKKIRHVADVVKHGSTPALIGASIVLAVFASLVELPCTAGFPIIYTGVLTGMSLGGLAYYEYVLLYNLFYVLPLIVIITVLAYTFKGKQIKKTTMALIKFIGGAIMLLLGILLLVNPGLILGV
ncbi:hypothetical protein GF367_04975 [Candidatus Woesearchaeota archaeon]|nr:hypothetical protein [Candidatus Woesearchaeota archaeon]